MTAAPTVLPANCASNLPKYNTKQSHNVLLYLNKIIQVMDVLKIEINHKT